jgi:hypothetical protein
MQFEHLDSVCRAQRISIPAIELQRDGFSSPGENLTCLGGFYTKWSCTVSCLWTIRLAIKSLLQRLAPEWQICGETGAAALELIDRHLVGLACRDLSTLVTDDSSQLSLYLRACSRLAHGVAPMKECGGSEPSGLEGRRKGRMDSKLAKSWPRARSSRQGGSSLAPNRSAVAGRSSVPVLLLACRHPDIPLVRLRSLLCNRLTDSATRSAMFRSRAPVETFKH